ncbi:MAG: BREX protein BrxB domain-containing protein [Bradymonadaceae bacterium]
MTKPDRMKGTLLDRRIHALREDITDEEGPKISTMRNYRFAILPYAPEEEWTLRQKVSGLASDLRAVGWVVHTLSLRKLMLRRIRKEAGDHLEKFIERERRLHKQGKPDRALNHVEQRLSKWFQGPDGLAADIIEELDNLVDEQPQEAERTLVFLGQVGALYPFIRTSALLRHLDGKTNNIPIVLLYPGCKENGGLSFMGEMAPNRDYRPRIYDA